jgi:hypothetical protein
MPLETIGGLLGHKGPKVTNATLIFSPHFERLP